MVLAIIRRSWRSVRYRYALEDAILFVAVSSLFWTQPVRAADIEVQVKGNETVEHDSNPLLLQTGGRPSIGSITSPEVLMSGDTPTLHGDIDNLLNVNEYNLANFSSVDYHGNFHTSAKGLSTFAGLNGSLDYDTTRTSELLTSGINIAGIRHTGISLTPQAGINLSPVDETFVNGVFSHTLYSNTVSFTDFSDYGVTPAYQHTFDPLNTGALLFNVNRYQTTNTAPVRIDTLGPSVEWIRKFTQEFSVTATAGYQKTISTLPPFFPPPTTHERYDYTYSVNAAFTGQQDVIHFVSTRSSVPSGNGTETLATNFTLTESHTITTRWVAELNATYQTQAYSVQATGNQSAYMSISPDLRYHITPNFDLVPSYRYRDKEFVGGATSVSSQAVFISLVFNSTKADLGW